MLDIAGDTKLFSIWKWSATWQSFMSIVIRVVVEAGTSETETKTWVAETKTEAI